MMRIRLRCFARLQELLGAEELWLELPAGADLGQVREELQRRCPAIGEERLTVLLARNGQYAEDATVIQPGDELAGFPPVSGG